jgi:tRNA A37 threonylcarbamoyladenosine dehydratase
MAILLHNKINTLYTQQKDLEKAFQPLFYRIYNEKDRIALSLLLDKPGVLITDYVLDQVKELMKISYPHLKLNVKQQEEAALEHIKPFSKEDYGVWVYYPWSNRLVHIVDEKEFIELRTSRNQYKITREERDLLAQKKIGVIGLSVGQSVSVTLAMERVGTELRLADFDVLELTNLNRIRSGVHNLGLPKVYVVAREIAEIDPFITVKCFPAGLSEENMDDFFTAGGKLDMLVEESDGFDIKILSRYKARELGIPVVMEANDRCTVDVERFDLEPQRSILHGLVDHLDVNILKTLKTNEEKIPYMLDVVGLETSSARLKASMLEIDQTITTWPQLASSVIMGGGIMGDVIRRILLNSYNESGRYHVDIEELIGNTVKTSEAPLIEYPKAEELTTDNMQRAISTLTPHRSSDLLDDQVIEQIVEAALLAPSAGNNQPWKWIFHDRSLYLFHDVVKSMSWLDEQHFISHIAFGTAIENVSLKSAQLGYEISYQLFPLPTEQRLIASIQFKKMGLNKKANDLVDFIATRHTNRKKGFQEAIIPEQLDLLKSIGEETPNVNVSITNKKNDIESIAEIVAAFEKIRFMHARGHYDFFTHEIRWRDDNSEPITEGLDIKTLELSLSQEIGLKVASNKNVIALLNEWHKGDGLKKISSDTIKASSAIGIITMPEFSSKNWIEAGRAVQKIWLTASKYDMAFQPISAPLFFHLKMKYDTNHALSEANFIELTNQYNKLIHVFPELSKNEGVFLFRIAKSDAPTSRSLRRPLKDVYSKL